MSETKFKSEFYFAIERSAHSEIENNLDILIPYIKQKAAISRLFLKTNNGEDEWHYAEMIRRIDSEIKKILNILP